MNRLKILNYHNIATPPSDIPLSKLYVDPQRFEQQCRLLQRLGLRGVTLSEGLAALERGESDRCVVLTFDDGYADNLIHAAPILKSFGFRATCYVVSGLIGSHNVWDEALHTARKPLMNRDQLQSWIAAGHEIGSHTVTHAHLHLLSRDAAMQEIGESRTQLQKLTGAGIDHFC